MKLAVDDVEMALTWIRQNSADAYVYVALNGAKCELRVGTPDNEVVTLTLFDADAGLQAKLLKEDYLKHNIKAKK